MMALKVYSSHLRVRYAYAQRLRKEKVDFAGSNICICGAHADQQIYLINI
jgi:hypothetical protein